MKTKDRRTARRFRRERNKGVVAREESGDHGDEDVASGRGVDAVVGEEVERGQEAVCWWLAGPWDGI
jgi:hypothetical protein